MKDKPSYSLPDNAEAKPTVTANTQQYRPPVKLLPGRPNRDANDAAKRLLRPGQIRRGEVVPLKSYPDAAALAHLVAQPRFTALSNAEAIDAALELLHDCQSALEKDARHENEAQNVNREIGEMPKPEKFPATLNDFYRLIIKAKKKDENQPRFRDFLRNQIEADETFRAANLDWSRKTLAQLEQQIADAARCGVTLVRQSGCLSPIEAAELYRKSIAQMESRHLDADGRERELDARFEFYSTEGFDENYWFICADEYPRWWLPEKTARKQKGGRARAKKAYEAGKRAKKVAPPS